MAWSWSYVGRMCTRIRYASHTFPLLSSVRNPFPPLSFRECESSPNHSPRLQTGFIDGDFKCAVRLIKAVDVFRQRTFKRKHNVSGLKTPSNAVFTSKALSHHCLYAAISLSFSQVRRSLAATGVLLKALSSNDITAPSIASSFVSRLTAAALPLALFTCSNSLST